MLRMTGTWEANQIRHQDRSHQGASSRRMCTRLPVGWTGETVIPLSGLSRGKCSVRSYKNRQPADQGAETSIDTESDPCTSNSSGRLLAQSIQARIV
jgi:hypothetical protein